MPCSSDSARTNDCKRSKLSAGPTHAYALMKRAIYAGADNNFEQQLALEVALQREAGAGADFREGVAAFLGKRPPVFTGR